MAGLLNWLMNVNDPAASFLKRANAEQKMLKATRAHLPGLPSEWRENMAVLEAFGCLHFTKNEVAALRQEGTSRILEALRQYRLSMRRELSIKSLYKNDAAARDAKLYGARRVFYASVPVLVTHPMMARIDEALGLPPIDPRLGGGADQYPGSDAVYAEAAERDAADARASNPSDF